MMEKEIVCSLEKEGFRGHFYPGCKETNKAIIFVGGASCDEKTSIAMSGFLRKEGSYELQIQVNGKIKLAEFCFLV